MTHVKASLVGVAAAVASLAATAASARTYDFTLLDNNGVIVDASGLLALTGDVIDSITGAINGYGAITGLISNSNSPNPDTLGNIIYDNRFDPLAPGVDNYGIFVSTASGTDINLFNLHSSGADIPDNTATVYDDNANVYAAEGAFTAALAGVPETAAWALMLIGMGLTGATLRSSREPVSARPRQ